MPKPWTDTPMHDCGDGDKGPVAPVLDHPTDDGNVELLRCCACGKTWFEDDTIKVAHAWWSAGAYEGKCEAEEC